MKTTSNIDLIISVMNLNSLFKHILKDRNNLKLWKEFGNMTYHLTDGKRIYFVPYVYGLNEIIEGPAIHNLKLQIALQKEAQDKFVKRRQFEKAVTLFEDIHRMEKLLDRESAKAYFGSDDYFHISGRNIGFCFTGDRVIDFLIFHYSPITRNMYYM